MDGVKLALSKGYLDLDHSLVPGGMAPDAIASLTIFPVGLKVDVAIVGPDYRKDADQLVAINVSAEPDFPVSFGCIKLQDECILAIGVKKRFLVCVLASDRN